MVSITRVSARQPRVFKGSPNARKTQTPLANSQPQGNIQIQKACFSSRHPVFIKGLKIAGKVTGAMATAFAVWITPRIMFVLNPEWTALDFTDPDGFHIGIREALQLSAGIWFGKTNKNSISATLLGGFIIGQYSPFYVYPVYSFYEAIKAKVRGNTPKEPSVIVNLLKQEGDKRWMD